MHCDVVLLPEQLQPHHLSGRVVAVFDVLRATTTITAALAAGVGEIHLFPDLAAVRAAASSHNAPHLLCGEDKCLKPDGFDLGNSPGQFADAAHAGAAVFLATTNGTRALITARGASVILVAALVNASAVARRIVRSKNDATMICAGTNGNVAMEDVLGAGAVVHALTQLTDVTLESDVATISLELFHASRDRLPQVLRTTRGGINVVRAGLEPDIDFAARLDAFQVVGIAAGDPLIVRADAAS